MKKNKLIIYSVLFSMLLLNACGEDDFPNHYSITRENIMEEDTEECLVLTISTDKEPATRCFENKYIYSLEVNQKQITGLPGENCESLGTIQNLYGLIYYNEELVYEMDVLYSGNIVNINTSPIIKSIQRKDGKVYLALKLDKSWDPSKIKMVFSAGLVNRVTPNNGTYWNLLDYFKYQHNSENEINIWNLHSDICCNYYCNHLLNDENNWGTINTTVILKRLNCDFIFLTTQYETGAPSQIESYLYAAPNSEDRIDNLYGKYTTSYSENNCRYYIEKDEASFELGKGLVYRTDRNQTVYLTPNSGRPAIKLPSFSYDSKTVYLFSLLSVLGSLEPKYLVNEEGEEIKYITLIRYDAFKYYLMSDQTKYYEWVTIPMPEGGIKANTRYIYILGNDFKFWQNRISKDELDEQASTRSFDSRENIQTEGITLIEQSMDEPLPFEVIEDI